MRLRTCFIGFVMAALAGGAATLLVLASTVRASERAAQDLQRAESSARQVASLLALTQEYVLYGEERAAHQWRTGHRQLDDMLRRKSADETAMDKDISNVDYELNALPELFEGLVRVSGQNRSNELVAKRRELLIDRLVAETQAISEDIYLWQVVMAQERTRSERRLVVLALALPSVMVVLLVTGVMLLGRRVLRPIASLQGAMADAAQGGLPQRDAIRSDDEVGDLWRSFDHMTDQLASRSQALRQALDEREDLLREVYHRVKNNMQVIQSLLTLKSRALTDGPSRAMVDEMIQRVQAMAMVHEKLYRSNNLAAIRLDSYLTDLFEHMTRASDLRHRRIALTADLPGVEAGLETAVPLGLLLSEVISNCVKHAFADREEGRIHVSIQPDATEGVILLVSDDGVGLSPGFDPMAGRSMGLKLVSSLARQLGGQLSFGESEEGGTQVRLRLAKL
jgi:two-component sensor histidine kinase